MTSSRDFLMQWYDHSWNLETHPGTRNAARQMPYRNAHAPSDQFGYHSIDIQMLLESYVVRLDSGAVFRVLNHLGLLFPKFVYTGSPTAQDDIESMFQKSRQGGHAVVALGNVNADSGFGHFHVIIVHATNKTRADVYDFDPIDYITNSSRAADFNTGHLSDYPSSGSVQTLKIVEAWAGATARTFQFTNLAKFCKNRKCVQYYFGDTEYCFVFSAFFVAAFTKLYVEDEMHIEDALKYAVTQTYQGAVHSSVPVGVVSFNASDASTTRTRLMYTAFVCNLVLALADPAIILDALKYAHPNALFYQKMILKVLQLHDDMLERFGVSLVMPSLLQSFQTNFRGVFRGDK